MRTSSVDNSGARFSAVIVNYNGGDMLGDCVRSALQEGIAPAQIIVVDNGSADNSIARMHTDFPAVPILHNGCNAGFARAVNQGLMQATGEFILLLNNDAQLEAGALRAFADAFDQISKLAIAGGQLRYPDGRLQTAILRAPTLISELLPHTLLQWIFPARFQGKSSGEEASAVEIVVGACLAVRRAVLLKLGLLDEDFFFFYEESEWCQRAWRLGFEVYHLPAARVLHLQGGTAKRFRGQARVEFQRSKLIFFKKTRTPLVYHCASLLITLATTVDALVNTVLCLLTCFAVKRLRTKTRVYLYLLAWHLLGRPDSWGLPDKCVRGKAQDGQNKMVEIDAFASGGSQQASNIEAVR